MYLPCNNVFPSSPLLFKNCATTLNWRTPLCSSQATELEVSPRHLESSELSPAEFYIMFNVPIFNLITQTNQELIVIDHQQGSEHRVAMHLPSVTGKFLNLQSLSLSLSSEGKRIEISNASSLRNFEALISSSTKPLIAIASNANRNLLSRKIP